MKSRTLMAVIAGLLLLALLLALAWRNQRALEAGLPPRQEFATIEACSRSAMGYAAAHGGTYVPIAGTGSMAPFIPPGKTKTHEEQKKEIVAFVVTDGAKSYGDTRAGDLCIYRPDWNDRQPVLHQAALHQGAGWVMTGLANAHSESMERMTEEKFTGIVAYAAVLATPEAAKKGDS